MLTPKLKKLLTFIDTYITKQGYAPSFDEMRVAMGLESKSGIARSVDILVERGYLRKVKGIRRGIAVVKDDGSGFTMTTVPDEVVINGKRFALVAVA